MTSRSVANPHPFPHHLWLQTTIAAVASTVADHLQIQGAARSRSSLGSHDNPSAAAEHQPKPRILFSSAAAGVYESATYGVDKRTSAFVCQVQEAGDGFICCVYISVGGEANVAEVAA